MNMNVPKLNIMMTTPGWVLLLFSFTARIPGKIEKLTFIKRNISYSPIRFLKNLLYNIIPINLFIKNISIFVTFKILPSTIFIELVAYNGECYNFQYCLNGCCRVFHYCFLLPQGIILYNPRKLMKNSRLCYIYISKAFNY